jgi:hypothetical protein
MPIYLVRWPDLSASLVRARDEDDLIDTLDQVANPEGCEWSVYKGPLFIDFRLPAAWRIQDARPGDPVAPEHVVVEDVGRMATEPIVEAMALSLAGDDGCATGMAILRTAFPVLHAAIEKLEESDEELASEGVVPEAALREALYGELVRRLQWSWRRAQLSRKTDPLSALARQMDLPMALAQKYAELAHGRRAADEENAPTTAEDERDAPESMAVATAPDVARAPTSRTPLFTVSNHHTAGCGEPPIVDGDAVGTYFGYFANEYGEQSIYTYDHGTGEATIRMGDADWHDVHRVEDGQAEGLSLTETEAMWLRACWLATGGLKDPAHPRPGRSGRRRTRQ